MVVLVVRKRRTIVPFEQKLGRMEIKNFRPSGCINPAAPLSQDTTTFGGSVTTPGSQVTDSEEHPVWRRRKRTSRLQDIGGDFFTQKQYVEGYPSLVSVSTGDVFVDSCNAWRGKYSGPVWSINASQFSFPPAMNSSVAQLNQLGTTAIARCNPLNSIADLATALGELLREGIPRSSVSHWESRSSAVKNAADDYLSVQFGWVPLKNDVVSFATGVANADLLLDQYERDAGKVVRRKFEFPPVKTIETVSVGSNTLVFYAPFNSRLMNSNLSPSQSGKLLRERTFEQRRWFSGAFTYYLPRGYNPRSEMSRKALLAKQILGVDLSPDTLWNLAPWTWAADWFSNAGDVMSNVSNFIVDGLVMPYGYMMEHTIVKDTYTRDRKDAFKDPAIVDSAVTLVTETKMRRKASPYGFGVSWDGLTTFQASILAALGITRSRH